MRLKSYSYYYEKLLDGIEWVHCWLARNLPIWIGWLWAKQRKMPIWSRFTVAFVVLALIAARMAWNLRGNFLAASGIDDVLFRYLENAGHIKSGATLSWFTAGAGGLCALAAGLAFFRRKIVFRLMEAAWSLLAVVGILYVNWTFGVGSILNAADHKAFDLAMRDEVWSGVVVSASFVVPVILAVLVMLLTTKARVHYRLRESEYTKDAGGKTIVNLKTGGEDPRHRSSLYWALFIFWCMIILPFLLVWFGWEKPYALPKGGGEMSVQQQVVVKKVKKKKKPKKITINPFSPYILERMNIDDVKTLEELEEATQDTYVATQNKRAGGKGKGTGGWPQGLENSRIRFIRLKYRGGDWDQDMGKGADYNLLLKFHEQTGMKIASETEAKTADRLHMFPKKRAPPFIFITGMGGMSLSEKEVKQLREYCVKEHGMLFIDNGGGSFGGTVRNVLRRIFPGKSLVEIPNDDTIYQQPYIFPEGAPPLWHHDGTRALGIRDEGRWLVFYHPGDINDAWKDGASGASPEVQDQAFKVGINVMFYAFSQYYHYHFGDDIEEPEP